MQLGPLAHTRSSLRYPEMGRTSDKKEIQQASILSEVRVTKCNLQSVKLGVGMSFLPKQFKMIPWNVCLKKKKCTCDVARTASVSLHGSSQSEP